MVGNHGVSRSFYRSHLFSVALFLVTSSAIAWSPIPAMRLLDGAGHISAFGPARLYRTAARASTSPHTSMKSPKFLPSLSDSSLAPSEFFRTSQVLRRRLCVCMAASGRRGGQGAGMPQGRGSKKPTKAAAPLLPSEVVAFKELLGKIGHAAPDEVPSLLTANLDLLLSRDIAGLYEEVRAGCSEAERADLEEVMEAVVVFLEEVAEATRDLSAQNQALLRAILEAAARGEQALDALMREMVAGSDARYTPEFLRFLDAEIARLSAEAARGGIADGKKDRSRFASQGSALGRLDEEEEEEEEEEERPGDALTASRTLAMVKARITSEMEAALGEDAWAAQLLARLLQVDEEALRVVALETALREMPDAYARAQFLDVARTTFEEVAAGGGDAELATRLCHVSEACARLLGIAGG